VGEEEGVGVEEGEAVGLMVGDAESEDPRLLEGEGVALGLREGHTSTRRT